MNLVWNQIRTFDRLGDSSNSAERCDQGGGRLDIPQHIARAVSLRRQWNHVPGLLASMP